MEYVTSLIEPRQRAVSTGSHEMLSILPTLRRPPTNACRGQRFTLPTLSKGECFAYILKTVTFVNVINSNVSIDAAGHQHAIIVAEPHREHLCMTTSHECQQSELFVARDLVNPTFSHYPYFMLPATYDEWSMGASGCFVCFFLPAYIVPAN